MSLTQDEFLKIQDVIKQVFEARSIGIKSLETGMTNDMGRALDPGTGLKYLLLEQKDGNFYFKSDAKTNPDYSEDIVTASKFSSIRQPTVSEYFIKMIAPESFLNSIEKFKDFCSSLDHKNDETAKSQAMESFQNNVLAPIYDQAVEYITREKLSSNNLYNDVNPHTMARYILEGLMLNTLPYQKTLDPIRPLISEATSAFKQSKAELEKDPNSSADFSFSSRSTASSFGLRSTLGLHARRRAITQQLIQPSDAPLQLRRIQTDTPNSLQITVTPSVQSLPTSSIDYTEKKISTDAVASAWSDAEKFCADLKNLFSQNSGVSDLLLKKPSSLIRIFIRTQSESKLTDWFKSTNHLLMSDSLSSEQKMQKVLDSYNQLNPNTQKRLEDKFSDIASKVKEELTASQRPTPPKP